MGAFFRNRHALNSRQRSIARALIQTFVGTESEVEQAALDLAVDRCDDFLQSLAEPESAAPLRLLLNVIHAYVMVRFRCLPAALNADQRTLLVRDLCEPETTRLGRALELLNRRAGKPLPSGRDLVRALKQMCVLVYYSNPETGALTGYVPIWKRAHILAAAPELDAPPVRVPISQINAKHREGRGTPVERLFANDGRPKVAIVGSGAGGAVVAARLAATCDVAVFEAGPSFTAREYPLDTLSGMALLYRDGLMSFSKNLDLQVLAGRLVGGGTALTSGMSVKPRRRKDTNEKCCYECRADPDPAQRQPGHRRLSGAQAPSSAIAHGAMIASLIPWMSRLSAGATVARIPPSFTASPATK